MLSHHLERHRLLRTLGFNRLAARDLETAKSLELTSADDLLLRADELRTAGQLVAAYQDADRAIELNTALADAYLLRGHLVTQMWHTPRGRDVLREKVEPIQRELEQLDHGRRIIARGNSPWQAMSCGPRPNSPHRALLKLRQADYDRAHMLETNDPNGQ